MTLLSFTHGARHGIELLVVPSLRINVGAWAPGVWPLADRAAPQRQAGRRGALFQEAPSTASFRIHDALLSRFFLCRKVLGQPERMVAPVFCPVNWITHAGSPTPRSAPPPRSPLGPGSPARPRVLVKRRTASRPLRLTIPMVSRWRNHAAPSDARPLPRRQPDAGNRARG